jgi:hypothetical protein
MKNYLKLVNFEFNRFFKVYAALIAITVVSQIIGFIVISKSYLNEANHVIYNNGLSKATFLEQYGTMSFYRITQTMWVMGPIVLCIAALIFYIFLIWYRDWFGKNTFIYRLLMLPTARLNIFFAKATTIFLMVLGLVALQILLLPVGSMIMKSLVPLEFRTDMSINEIISTFNYLAILFPNSWIDFSIHYVIGFMAVFILFTAVLFERSFGIKGIILGVIYCVIAQVFLFIPLIITVILEKPFLYPMEYFVLEIVLGAIVIGTSIIISRFLLNKKITV